MPLFGARDLGANFGELGYKSKIEDRRLVDSRHPYDISLRHRDLVILSKYQRTVNEV